MFKASWTLKEPEACLLSRNIRIYTAQALLKTIDNNTLYLIHVFYFFFNIGNTKTKSHHLIFKKYCSSSAIMLPVMGDHILLTEPFLFKI